jgi:hypothetical protein
MVKIFALEKFKEFNIDPPRKFRYAISNYGRLVSFIDKIEDGVVLKGSKSDGYRLFTYKERQENGEIKNKSFFLYKLVADAFLEKTSDDQVSILHLDRNRANDFHLNLKWATREERLEFVSQSPFVIEAKKKLIEYKKKADGSKLTSTNVILIKKMLADPKRNNNIKAIAKRFNVSPMQIYRIKRGENWGHIEI